MIDIARKTIERLAQSRKFLAAIGAGVTAAAAIVLPFLALIPGWNAAATDRFLAATQLLAGLFVGLAGWFMKLTADEDAAEKGRDARG